MHGVVRRHAVLARKQTDGENEDDSGARTLTRRFCHRYYSEDRMLECLWLCVDERDMLRRSSMDNSKQASKLLTFVV